VPGLSAHSGPPGLEDPRVTVYDKLTYAGRRENLDPVKNLPAFRLVRGEILNPLHFRWMLEEEQPNVVYRPAAEFHVAPSIEDETNFIRANVQGATLLLDVALDYYRYRGFDDVARGSFKFMPPGPHFLDPSTRSAKLD